MRKTWWLFTALLLASAPALAGPGGRIASAAFSTFWGKVALAVLTIVLLPFIVWHFWQQRQATRRARADLQFMASHDARFDWLQLRERVTECFHAVHGAWSDADVLKTSPWMTDWYRQNQQAQLDRWARAGLVNVCEVKKLSDVKPLFFVHRNNGAPHEGSSVAVLMSATMKDYLVDQATGKVSEGTKDFHGVDTVWTFVLRDGEWRVNGIEQGDLSVAYARLIPELPPIESTLLPGSATGR